MKKAAAAGLFLAAEVLFSQGFFGQALFAVGGMNE